MFSSNVLGLEAVLQPGVEFNYSVFTTESVSEHLHQARAIAMVIDG